MINFIADLASLTFWFFLVILNLSLLSVIGFAGLFYGMKFWNSFYDEYLDWKEASSLKFQKKTKELVSNIDTKIKLAELRKNNDNTNS